MVAHFAWWQGGGLSFLISVHRSSNDAQHKARLRRAYQSRFCADDKRVSENFVAVLLGATTPAIAPISSSTPRSPRLLPPRPLRCLSSEIFCAAPANFQPRRANPFCSRSQTTGAVTAAGRKGRSPFAIVADLRSDCGLRFPQHRQRTEKCGSA